MMDIKRNLCEKSTYVIDSFSERGLDIHPVTRFIQMKKVLFSKDGTPKNNIEHTDHQFEIALESLRDLIQLEFIFDSDRSDPFINTYMEKFEKIVKDSVSPQNDQKKSQGRDTQTEFFVFAVCRKAGFQNV